MIGSAKEHRDMFHARILEIDSELAEMKRKYIVDRTEAPLSIRVTLEAERSRCRVEINALYHKIHANKKADEALKDCGVLGSLIVLLQSLDLGHLVREAQRISIDATQRAYGAIIPHSPAAA